MLAPAALVTAVVVAFGFMLGSEPAKKEASEGAPTGSISAPSPQGAQVGDDPAAPEVLGIDFPFLVAPATVLERKPHPKFRVFDSYSFTIGTFNVLGHSHTTAGGNKPGYAASVLRMGWTLGLLNSHSIDLVGLQEYEIPQHNVLMARAGGSWDVWPGAALGRQGVSNSVAWRDDMFRAVEKRTIPVPYFHGKQKPMPYVLLEHIATGQRLWLANFHNPADTRGSAGRYRAEATRRQVELANTLSKTGWPVFFTGDFNDKADYFCPFTAGTELKHAAGGSTEGTCQPPAGLGIDQIFGSDFVEFGGYNSTRGGLVGRASDHPIVSAGVTIPEHKEPIKRRKRR